jgi:hypothetical protein
MNEIKTYTFIYPDPAYGTKELESEITLYYGDKININLELIRFYYNLDKDSLKIYKLKESNKDIGRTLCIRNECKYYKDSGIIAEHKDIDIKIEIDNLEKGYYYYIIIECIRDHRNVITEFRLEYYKSLMTILDILCETIGEIIYKEDKKDEKFKEIIENEKNKLIYKKCEEIIKRTVNNTIIKL